jgi:hypothetical protein
MRVAIYRGGPIKFEILAFLRRGASIICTKLLALGQNDQPTVPTTESAPGTSSRVSLKHCASGSSLAVPLDLR